MHCRADAIPHRNPLELTTGEGFALIDQVRSFGDPPPLFVLTGGDPMRRPDLADLVRHGVRSGLTVALTPSGTAAVTRGRLTELRHAGLSRIAVSLDGPTAATHDAFRRVRDPDALEGKCGRCEYRAVCGGSRARAYHATGSPCGPDPLCAYEPPFLRE